MGLEQYKRDHGAVLTFLEKLFKTRRKDIYYFWKDFLRYEINVIKSRKIIIAGPSHILGVGVIDELDKTDVRGSCWREYSPVRSFKIKKEMSYGVIEIDGFFFSTLFIDMIFKIFGNKKDLFELKVITNEKGDSALLLKWYDEYCFACAEVIDARFTFEKGGVTLRDTELNDNDEWVVRQTIFSNIKDGLAIFLMKYGHKEWNKYLMTKDYFFEEIEETGSFLDV